MAKLCKRLIFLYLTKPEKSINSQIIQANGSLFYPKDDTPGCTKEACISVMPVKNIEKGVEIVGISDSVKSHENFLTNSLKFSIF
jgi:alkyl hydroperoxide reductase subunit AhpC